MIQINFLQNKNRLTDKENKFMVIRDERYRWREIKEKLGISIYMLLYIK